MVLKDNLVPFSSLLMVIGILVIAFIILSIELGGDINCNFKPMLLFQQRVFTK